MRAENPAALRYLLQDDIYLLQSDKINLNVTLPAVELTQTNVVDPAKQPQEVLASATQVKQPEPATQPSVLTVETETPALAYNYLGNNKKYFLVLTNYANDDFIAADHLTALQNILGRKGYELADIAIFNVAKASYTIIDIVTHFKPEKLLILGETAVPAGMGVPPLNQPKKMKNGVLLRSFSFDEMMSSTDNKKAFWEQVKNL
ncbi:MAG: hypothetical protein V4619_02945 [Bacteroidota bacterium]